jgi:transcriptional regulator with XRE-family HTH domain
VSGWEKRGEKPIPLYWDAPLREALERLEAASPEERIRALVAARPGITRRGVRRELGQAKGVGGALRAMVGRELVEREARDAIGKIQPGGLYLPGQDASAVFGGPSGPQLRAWRRRTGWRLEDLAAELGRPARSLRRAETQERVTPALVASYRETLERPAPRRTGSRQSALRALLDRLEDEGEIPMPELRHSMIVAPAIEDGHAHVEERPATTAGGHKVMRRVLVAGPGDCRAGASDPMGGEELRRTREAAGLSQVDVAALLGVSNVTVSAWERRGVPAARVADVRAALDALGLTAKVTAYGVASGGRR